MKNCIISLEGLDCSFKETNYKMLVDNLRTINNLLNRRKIHTESFPRYGHWSAMGVEKWLDGSFDRNVLKQHPKAIDSMYSIDRFSYWYEKITDPNTGISYRRIDLLNNGKNNIFVFDRYNLSNAIYNPIYPECVHIEDLLFDKETFAIPNPDIVIWMRMNNFDTLASLISKKENKDANELDLEFLRSVWERSEKVINSKCLFKSLGINLIVIECLNDDGSIRDRKSIANQIWEEISKYVIL